MSFVLRGVPSKRGTIGFGGQASQSQGVIARKYTGTGQEPSNDEAFQEGNNEDAIAPRSGDKEPGAGKSPPMGEAGDLSQRKVPECDALGAECRCAVANEEQGMCEKCNRLCHAHSCRMVVMKNETPLSICHICYRERLAAERAKEANQNRGADKGTDGEHAPPAKNAEETKQGGPKGDESDEESSKDMFGPPSSSEDAEEEEVSVIDAEGNTVTLICYQTIVETRTPEGVVTYADRKGRAMVKGPGGFKYCQEGIRWEYPKAERDLEPSEGEKNPTEMARLAEPSATGPGNAESGAIDRAAVAKPKRKSSLPRRWEPTDAEGAAAHIVIGPEDPMYVPMIRILRKMYAASETEELGEDDEEFLETDPEVLRAEKAYAPDDGELVEAKREDIDEPPLDRLAKVQDILRYTDQAGRILDDQENAIFKEHRLEKAWLNKRKIEWTEDDFPTYRLKKPKVTGQDGEVTDAEESTEEESVDDISDTEAEAVEASDIARLRGGGGKRKDGKILREIRRLQKSTELQIPKAAIERLCREIGNQVVRERSNGEITKLTWREGSVEVVHEAAEMLLVSILQDAYKCSLNANRVTLQTKDMATAIDIRRDEVLDNIHSETRAAGRIE